MRLHRWAWLLASLGVSTACGGRQVTSESSSSDAPPASGSGGTVGSGGAGGAPSNGVAGTMLGSAGTGTPVVRPRCSFASTASVPFTASAPPAVVQSRIERFILNEAKTPLMFPPPDRVTPEWASGVAMRILDSFGQFSSSSPGGFIRWLAKWSYDGKAPASSAVWALTMADSSATLSSLIAAPNPSAPHTAGYLTDPELLAGRPTIDRRGMMVARQLLCRVVPDIPAGVVFPPPVSMPGITEREAHQQVIGQALCASCHSILDPFGNAFGHFDRNGAYRELDNGQPIDASGQFNLYNDFSDSVGPVMFSSIESLGQILAQSCDVALCVSRSMLREAIDPNLASNAEAPFADEEVIPIANAFVDSGFSLRALVRGIVESPAFLR